MTVVVKVGGAAGNAVDPALDELVERRDVVVVHGGSAEVDRLGEAMGLPPEYYTSPSGVVSRHTDAAHLEVVVLALAGRVQTSLVSGLARRGVTAVGLSGVDGRLLTARRKEGARAVVDGRVVRVADEHSGQIESADVSLLRHLLDRGVVPVVGPPALTSSGEIVNVDADRAASVLAVGLAAEALVLLTNVDGLLRDPSDAGTRIPRVARDELPAALALAAGRMRKKVIAAREALAGGVPRVAIGRSSVERPVARALGGGGTIFA